MSTTRDLHGRQLLTHDVYSREELVYLLDLAAELKAAKLEGREEQRLRGKNIALISETDSTRTRSPFEVAAYDQGAKITFVGPTGPHMGRRETVKDIGRVLGRMYDAIEYRGSREQVAEELALSAGVPVYDGLTDEGHPTQILADFLTFEEHVPKPLDEVAFCYLGDASCKPADAYLISGLELGMDVRIASPNELWPRQEVVALAHGIARQSGAQIVITEEIEPAVRAADVLLTGVWGSVGEPAEAWRERIELLLPYQVNARTMARTGNPNVKFMYCLPSFHHTGTGIGKELCQKYGLQALEVTDAVFESPASIVSEQAENRMHTIKALLVATLGSGG
ncbi:MAG TPA: ornithine carbamoyltransferase [Solirubrobacteraceae bacterium]|nr:ornithine carbamoyltransferase [Solirubrobacteraceae bacterium]